MEAHSTQMAKSSICLPAARAAVSHLGFSPRPLHELPFMSRYLASTFLRLPLLTNFVDFALPEMSATERPCSAIKSCTLAIAFERSSF